ncbi:MAG: DUF4215 domain-containing protein [Myxococcota bacterium]|nr:DUF4215 domain-containing protein [Myxococcota bacterium]
MRQLIALAAALGWSACVQVKEVEVCSTDAGPAGVNLCGNSVVDPGEQCDDGNPRNGDGCSNQCQREARPECGNGVLEGGEACDDGNGVDDDACGNDCELTADNNDSWEFAADGRFGGQVVDAIFPAGDQDYFRFEGEQGQWLIITTDANADADDELVDTVITLYNSERTRIAQNDNYDDGEADSRIITRLPATDTYYLKVQDAQNGGVGAARGARNFVYTLKIRALATDAEQVNLDAEAGDDAESAQAMGWSERYHYAWVVGGFERSGDVDTYAFSIPTAEEAGDKTQFDMNIYKASPSGNGSTRPVGRVWITNSDGAVVARRTPANDFDTFAPNLAPGDYTFWVEHPGGEAGANDFYVLLVYRRGDNDPEQEEETNGSLERAERVSLSPNGSLQSHFALAQLPDGDVDYFRVDLQANQRLTVVCRSRSAGSGVVDLTVSVRDGNDEELSATIEDSERAYLRDANPGRTEAGPVYVRLSKAGQLDDVVGHFVRCGIHSRNR